MIRIRFIGSALSRAVALCALLALAACSSTAPGASANRSDGEGYAGNGALVLRIGSASAHGGLFTALFKGHDAQGGAIEIRYRGLDAAGRARFERRDTDPAAGPVVPPTADRPRPTDGDTPGTTADGGMPDTREIFVDMRLSRQIRVRGRIIEILEATESGVVFRLY